MASSVAIDLAPALTQDGVDLSNIETRIGHLLRKTICTIKGVSNLQQVTSLVISLDLHVLHSCFAEMVNLEHLSVTGCIRRIDNLNTLPKLKSLDFSNNKLTDTQGLEGITTLESLKLDHNPICRLNAGFLSTLPSLRKLSLCGTSVTALLPTIEALRALPSLEELSFHKNCDHHQYDDDESEDDADDQASNASAATAASNASAVTAASNTSGTTAASNASGATAASRLSSVSAFSTIAHRDENDVSDDDDFQSYQSSTSTSSDEDSDEEQILDMPEDTEIAHAPPQHLWNKAEAIPATPITTYPYYREYTIVQLPRLKVLDKIPIDYAERERARAVVRENFELTPDNPYKFLCTRNMLPQRKTKPSTPTKQHKAIHFKQPTNTSTSTSHSSSHCDSHSHSHPYHNHPNSHTDSHIYNNNLNSSAEWDEPSYSDATHHHSYLSINDNSKPVNNNNHNYNADLHATTHRLSKLLVSKELGPMRAPVFRKGMLAERISESSLSRQPKLTIHQTVNLVPRQFEYHPTISEYALFGSTQGDVVILNQHTSKIVHQANARNQSNILGLCWLHQDPMKFLAGSDNGAVSLYDVNLMQRKKNPVSFNFPEFLDLTSVHANCTDTLFVASGYSHDVGLFDLVSGKRINTFKDVHAEHINVIKFSNHDPNLFATSSFDRTIKLWDLRQPINPLQPVYSRQSDHGNVMVVFSPDDKYLLASAVDNEIRQYTCSDGRLHTFFDTPRRNSLHNYTRSYYMNNGEYIIVGSCDENIVRIYNSSTGRLFREVEMAYMPAPYGMLYIQSLRGDPLIPFNFTVLVSYNPAIVPSRLVHVSLLDSPES